MVRNISINNSYNSCNLLITIERGELFLVILLMLSKKKILTTLLHYQKYNRIFEEILDIIKTEIKII